MKINKHLLRPFLSFFEAKMEYPEIREALEALLSHDPDAASVINNAGFNKMDGTFARSLARQSQWTQKQALAAYKMLGKYRNQLQRSFGIDYETIPKPALSPEEVSIAAPSADQIGALSDADLFNKVVEFLRPKPIEPAMMYGTEVHFSAPAVPEFWTYWRWNKEKMKSIGFIVSKVGNDFTVFLVDNKFTPKVVEAGEKVEEFLSTPDDNEITLKFSDIIFDWQQPFVKQGLKILMQNKAMLDASTTGAGKTFITLGVLRETGFPFIVICPKTIIPQWEEACATFKLKALLILNYESIKLGKTPYYVEGPENRSKSNMKWDVPKNTVIIFDEAHKTKNFATGNAKLLQDATAQKIMTYMLSATIGENPLKLRSVGEALNLFDNYWEWAMKRGVRKGQWGMEFVGGKSDMMQVHQDIFGKNKGIRVPREVLASKLPPERKEVKLINFANKSKISKTYADLEAEVERLKGLENAAGNILAARTRARQSIELLKVPDIVNMTEDLIEEGNSVVIFTNFNETLKHLAKELKTDCIISGSMGNRKKAQDDFQADREHIILVQIKAGGAGLSLHDLNGEYPRVALINPTDSAQDLAQAIGRVFRAGGKTPVLQQVLFAKGTVEEDIAYNVKRKITNINSLNDGDLAEPFLQGYFESYYRQRFTNLFLEMYSPKGNKKYV